MLSKLLDLLRKEFIKSDKELKTISTSCCSNISTRAIDFDQVKDRFSEVLQINKVNMLKSVDALVLKNDTLYLIEMKKYDSTGSLTLEEFTLNRFEKFKNKIIDSIFILWGLVGYYNIDKNFYSYFLDPTKLKIKTVFLCNYSAQDYLKINTLLLPFKEISITNRVDKNIKFLTCELFYANVN